MSSYYICPECGGRSPVRLLPRQKCQECQRKRIWNGFGNRAIRIDPNDVGSEKDHTVSFYSEKYSNLSAASLTPFLTGFLLITVAGILTWKFRYGKVEGNPLDFLGHFNLLAVFSFSLSFLAIVLIGCGLLVVMKPHKLAKLPIAAAFYGTSGIVIGCLIMIMSVTSWLSISRKPTPWRKPIEVNRVQMQMLQSTAVLLSKNRDEHEKHVNIGGGVVIHIDSTQSAWVLTSSYSILPTAKSGSRAIHRQNIWVMLADAQLVKSNLRWVGGPDSSLSLVEVPINIFQTSGDNAVAASSYRPYIESAVLPSQRFSFIPNPLNRQWTMKNLTVLSSITVRERGELMSLIRTSSRIQENDVGSGIFDAAGNLVGIHVRPPATNGLAEAVTLPSDLLNHIERISKS